MHQPILTQTWRTTDQQALLACGQVAGVPLLPSLSKSQMDAEFRFQLAPEPDDLIWCEFE